jgi:hypothetical protein
MRLEVVSGTGVTLEPTFDYRFNEVQEKSINRTITGVLGTFVNSPGFTRFEVPISFISSSDRAVVNSWYNSTSTLQFSEDQGVSDVTTVRIMGEVEPFPQYADPYEFIEYAGMLVLESVIR